jgi:Ca2+-transporting ATPase
MAIHVLTINLVTDGLPGTALAFDPPTQGVMQVPPRDPDEPVLTKRDLLDISVVGVAITIVTLVAFLIGLNMAGAKGLPLTTSDDAGAIYAQTFAFLTLSISQFFNVFLCRERRKSIIHGPSINKILVFSVIISIVFMLFTLRVSMMSFIPLVN